MALNLGSLFSSQQGMQARALIPYVSYILYSLGSFPSERGASTQSLLGVPPSCKALTAKQRERPRRAQAGAQTLYVHVHKGAQVSLVEFMLLSTF